MLKVLKACSLAALISFAPLAVTSAGASQPRRLVSPRIMAMTWKVHECEFPANWRGDSTYPDGIGMTLANWLQFRAPSFPSNPQNASPREQAWVLAHFLGHYRMAWPHQGYPAYCGPGY